MKYYNTEITFREIPDEVTLCINISNCPVHCPGCHSKWLWADTGTPLNASTIDSLIAENPGITCIALMGGDGERGLVIDLCKYIKDRYGLKVGWYSGMDFQWDDDFHVDYYKCGPYIDEYGGLDSPSTNQRFYMWSGCEWKNCNHLFQHKK